MSLSNGNRLKMIADVPVIKQYPVLPTGCEATALTMLLQWAGVPVEKEAVADALVKEPLPFEQNGRKLGGHPNRGFVGDPYSAESYGVFHEPIAAVLEHFLPGRAADLTGLSFAELLQVIDSGRPVVVWATIELREPHVNGEWEDASGSGERIVWKSPQHAMLLIGYDEACVVANDPHTGGTERYARELFAQRFAELGCQAVTISDKKD